MDLPPYERPLDRARFLAALRSLRHAPAPGSGLAEATAPTTLTIRAERPEKERFADLVRDLEALHRRPVPGHEAMRWLLAYVAENEMRFFAATEALAAR